MPNDFVIYHNPRCSKSRQALAILHAAGIEPVVIEYLKTPPDAKTLRSFGLPAREIIRAGEDEYTALQLDKKSDAELIAAIVKHPILLQRPIVVRGKHAIVARPPERVEELLG